MTSLIKVVELAKIARLSLSDSAVEELAIEIDDISVWLNKLADINTDHVEPLSDLSKELNN